MTWKKFKNQKKSILIDHNTGERYELKNSRYGSKNRKECKGGCMASGFPRSHDSIQEAMYCIKLGILKKIGEIKSYDAQVTYPLTNYAGKRVGSARVDFVVTLPDGRKQVREYKGRLFETLRDFRMARALFTWCYPDLEYLTVTEKDLL